MAVDPTKVLARVEARRLDRSQQAALVAAPGGLGGRRLHRPSATSRRRASRTARRGHRQRHRRGADPARPGRRPGGPRPAPGVPAHRADADAERAGRRAWGSSSAPGPACTPRSAPAPAARRRSRYGLDLIRAGRADVVVVGGTEACVHPLPIAGFAADAGACPPATTSRSGASRPFDKGRDGFVLGEGAGVLVLERADHAAARGADPVRGARRRRHHLRRLPHHRARPGGHRRGPRDHAWRCGTPTSTARTSCT